MRLLKWLDFDFSDSNLSNSSPNMRGRSMMAGHREGGIIRGYHRLRGNYCWHYYPKPSIRRLGHCTQCRLMITGHDAYKRLAYPQCQCQCTFWSLSVKLLVNIDTFTQNQQLDARDLGSLGSLDPIHCAVSILHLILGRPKDTHIFPQNSNRKDFSLWTHCIYIIYYINHTCD